MCLLEHRRNFLATKYINIYNIRCVEKIQKKKLCLLKVKWEFAPRFTESSKWKSYFLLHLSPWHIFSKKLNWKTNHHAYLLQTISDRSCLQVLNCALLELHSVNTIHYLHLLFFKFTYLFLVAFGLHCCMRAFSSCSKQELLWLQCVGLSCSGAQTLGAQASAVADRGLRCSVAHGSFQDQGSNPCPLHWQTDS